MTRRTPRKPKRRLTKARRARIRRKITRRRLTKAQRAVKRRRAYLRAKRLREFRHRKPRTLRVLAYRKRWRRGLSIEAMGARRLCNICYKVHPTSQHR